MPIDRNYETDPAVSSDPTEIVTALNDLLQLDHDAVGAYEIAVEHLENRSWALQIESFKREHERHIRDLNDLILRLGGTPSNEPHASAPLKEGIQRISAAGGDRALLAAWRTNELYSMTKYESYVQRPLAWSSEARRVLERNALDEERHYRWAVTVLGERANEAGRTIGLKEGLPGEGSFAAAAKEKTTRMASAARAKAAEGLGQVADRLDRIVTNHPKLDGFRGKAAESAQRLAKGLDSTARQLRDGGVPADIGGAVSREIRQNPARSLLATFAIGFVVGRALR